MHCVFLLFLIALSVKILIFLVTFVVKKRSYREKEVRAREGDERD